MYQEAFKKLKPEQSKKLLEKINPLMDGAPFDSDDTTIMAQDISFYAGYRYLDIADYSSIPTRQCFVVQSPNKKNFTVLDWTNAPIYQLNKDAPLELSEETAADYLRFFFGHVRGKNGRFLIAENIDDIRWRDDPPPAARKSIGKMILPLIVKAYADDGAMVVPLTLMFKDSLFQAEAHIAINGDVALKKEHVLVEDMPVLDDTFGQ